MKKIICIVMVLFCLGLFGCSDCPSEEDSVKAPPYKKHTAEDGEVFGAWMFPEGSTNIKRVGKHWYEFTYKEKRFLYIKSYQITALTELRD